MKLTLIRVFRWLAMILLAGQVLFLAYVYSLDSGCKFISNCKGVFVLWLDHKVNDYFRSIYSVVTGYQWRIVENPTEPFVESFLLFAYNYLSPVIVLGSLLLIVFVCVNVVVRIKG
jgi:hypothetical protein